MALCYIFQLGKTYDSKYTNSDGFNLDVYSNLIKDIWNTYDNIKYGIDISKVKGNLVFSSKADGDRIYLRKREVTKSLKKLFNEMKIPPEERSRIAVLRDGENLVWVEGVGIDGNYIKKADSDEVYVIIKDGLKL